MSWGSQRPPEPTVNWGAVKLSTGSGTVGQDARSNTERYPAPPPLPEADPVADCMRRIGEIQRGLGLPAVPAAEMLARLEGYSKATILEARRELGVTTEQRVDGWYWFWPT